jgi:putative DNA modification/repair radical SAM protein
MNNESPALPPHLMRKLAILADAAKYDASCASSGAAGRTSRDKAGLGSTTGSGICHAFTPDGRCVSLLKLLLTNVCVYDCAYCVNRSSSSAPRARFKVEEIVALTLGFYRRNMIEGLFLSSGIFKNEDHTMEQMTRVVETLRRDHGFRGYIHLKSIAGAAPELIERAGRVADRLSVNVEFAKDDALTRLAPEKDGAVIRKSMGELSLRLDEAQEERAKSARAPRFAPAGHSTQMIVGADEARDDEIIGRAAALYRAYRLKRVYYSAFSPIPHPSLLLPPERPPLLREHRLYQADWMMRFYGFAPNEILQGATNGMLDLDRDPKLAWALANRALFPVDVNRAPREMLLRVPGLGVRVVERVLSARRHARLRLVDLARLCRSLDAVRPFVATPDWRPTAVLETAALGTRHAKAARSDAQLDLFAAAARVAA